MARILCVGNAVLDLVFTVSDHPTLDEKARASALRVEAGGNAANSARVLRLLGHEAGLGALLGDHPSGTALEEGLRRAGVDLSPCHRVSGMPPVSAILLARPGGQRTIVHHRALPEYGPEQFAALDLSRWDQVHFEARPGTGTQQMVRQARAAGRDLPISIEVEKPRPGIEEVFALAQLVLFSRGYAEGCGFCRPEDFLRKMRERVAQPALAAGWGDQGAWAIGRDGTLHHAPAVVPPQVVDTIGAGDTFNAGMIAALAESRLLPQALAAACRLAGRKVGQCGFDGLAAGW